MSRESPDTPIPLAPGCRVGDLTIVAVEGEGRTRRFRMRCSCGAEEWRAASSVYYARSTGTKPACRRCLKRRQKVRSLVVRSFRRYLEDIHTLVEYVEEVATSGRLPGEYRQALDRLMADLWESDSDELRPQVSLSRAAFDLQWAALVECSADELDVSALPHRRALRAIGSTADVAYERLCRLLRLFNGHFEVTGPEADALARAWEEGAEAAFDAEDPGPDSDYIGLFGRALDEFYASNPYRKGVGDE